MTILFYDDWKKHPGAIIDTDTPNKSFLRLSALYRDMGIKNHSFILALYDPSLKGIDPFDPTLSVEQMMSIALECKKNFWYYVREVAKVPGSGLSRQPLRANRGNIALYWLFLNHISVFLIQPRQTGKSFSVDELMSYVLNIASTDTYVAMLTKDETLRARALGRLKSIIDELPYYLNQKTKKDVANTEEVTIKRLSNRYKGMLPSRSPKAALNVGRGLTAPIFHIDEIAFLYNISITLPSALPATSEARSIAKKKGEPYGNIFTTTAGKKDDSDGRYVYDLVQESAIWTEKFFDAYSLTDLEDIVRLNSPSGEFKVNCTFNHRQLGYTDNWLREQLELTKSKGEDADRDYFNLWTSGTQSSPFTSDIADRIRKSEIPDANIDIAKPYNYIVRWYIPLSTIEQRMSTSQYVLGVDTSDAVGRDDIAMVLIDVATGEVMAAANINETNIITYSRWLATWITNYPTVTVIIERRSTGSAIIDMLTLILLENKISPFKRLYNKAVQEKDDKQERFKEISNSNGYGIIDIVNKYKATFGFATSGGGITSRSELYSTTLLSAVKATASTIRDTTLINQMLSLMTKNGRVDHQTGGHDDSVVAYLLAYWLISQGKNLSYYGIDTRRILVNNTEIKKHSSKEGYDRARQSTVQSEIQKLIEELQSETNDFVFYKKHARLQKLLSEITDDTVIVSVGELVESLKESRKLNKRISSRMNSSNYGQSTYGYRH